MNWLRYVVCLLDCSALVYIAISSHLEEQMLFSCSLHGLLITDKQSLFSRRRLGDKAVVDRLASPYRFKNIVNNSNCMDIHKTNLDE